MLPYKRPQGAPDAPEPLGELSRLWSPAELREHEQSRLRYGIGRVLSQLAADVLGKKLKPKTVVKKLRKLADWIEAELAPKPKAAEQGDLELEHPEPKPPDDVVTVFAYWQRLTSRPNTALTKKRRKAIAEMLKSFTVDDLKLIISTAHQSKFWSGEETNEGTPIDHIQSYMTQEHCEKLLEEGKRGGQMTLGESTVDSVIEELEDRAMRLSEEGRTEEANAVQREISDRLGEG